LELIGKRENRKRPLSPWADFLARPDFPFPPFPPCARPSRGLAAQLAPLSRLGPARWPSRPPPARVSRPARAVGATAALPCGAHPPAAPPKSPSPSPSPNPRAHDLSPPHLVRPPMPHPGSPDVARRPTARGEPRSSLSLPPSPPPSLGLVSPRRPPPCSRRAAMAPRPARLAAMALARVRSRRPQSVRARPPRRGPSPLPPCAAPRRVLDVPPRPVPVPLPRPWRSGLAAYGAQPWRAQRVRLPPASRSRPRGPTWWRGAVGRLVKCAAPTARPPPRALTLPGATAACRPRRVYGARP
jgi:hypothetical protein